jgi:hypothetical protein
MRLRLRPVHLGQIHRPLPEKPVLTGFSIFSFRIDSYFFGRRWEDPVVSP